MNKKTAKLLGRIQELGFSWDEAAALRRIEMTLQRWGEAECGDSNEHCSVCVERDESTGKPFRVVYRHDSNEPRRYAIPDLEKGALKRLAVIMARHPDFTYYHQTDCRECNLYLLRKSDFPASSAASLLREIESNYTRGFAVCE